LQRRKNQLRNAVLVDEEVIVPDSQNAKSLRTKESVALCVFRASGVLTTVEFDDQPSGKTDEIRNVEFDRHLAPKFETREAVRTQDLPQAMLRVRRAGPHFLGSVTQL
jgi:hypothetical protein